MATLDSLLWRVVDEVPAVSELMAMRALSDATREFCSATHAWVADLEPVQTVPGDRFYALAAPVGLRVTAPKDVRLDGRKLKAVDSPTLRARGTTTGSKPMEYAHRDPSVIELIPAPQQAETMQVAAALTLTLDETAVDLPDWLLGEYGEAIAAGAKMRLVRQKSQPWYDPDAAPAYVVPFYTAISRAKARAMSAMGEADMKVQMRDWT